MSDNKHLTVITQDGVNVICFNEPTMLSAYHVGQAGQELTQLVENRGLRVLVIDLASIKMISSQSLSVFLSIHQKVNELGGRMALSGIDPKLYRVFKVTSLQNVFEFFPDVAAAVAALKQP